MHHDTALIATIAAGLGLAFVLGLLAVRLRLPPLVGYLVAGVLVGPFTPGFVADAGLAQQLSEIGVILLMFGVGMHFSPGDLLSVRRIALPGAAVQIAIATVLGTGLAHLLGWSWGSGLVFGLCLSVASTVVLLRALEDRGLVDSVDGRIAIGWLVVEDIATVLVLVLLPALSVPLGGRAEAGTAPAGNIAVTLAVTLTKVAAFVALMALVGRRAVPWLLERVARLASRELFTLSVLAVALGIAYGASALFDVSFALGAFFAGMVVNGSDLSHEAAADSLPLQDAFSVLFFVAVGMLFDPMILVRQPLELLVVLFIILIGKSVGAFGIVLTLGYPVHTALTISASLAQIGEFSFILASLGVTLGLLTTEAQGLIVAGALLSISLNPLVFTGASRLSRWISARPKLVRALERDHLQEPEPMPSGVTLSGHTILVGYGRVGSVIGEALKAAEVPFVAVEQNREVFETLRDHGVPVVYGNAARANVLHQAGPERARLLVLTTPDPFQSRAIVDQARKVNAGIGSIVRTHSAEERAYLDRFKIGLTVDAERELALAMARFAIRVCGPENE